MYWPIGAPSIYEQDIPSRGPTLFHDGLEPGRSQEPDQLIPDIQAHNISGLSPGPNGEFSREQQHGNTAGAVAGAVNGAKEKRGESFENGTHITEQKREAIIGIGSSRVGHLFATITAESLTVWQTKPTVVLASVTRSSASLQAYGRNVSVLLRPDGAILVIQTSGSYLITYSLTTDPDSFTYQLVFLDNDRRHARRRSVAPSGRFNGKAKDGLLDGGGGVLGASLRFRMVIKIDAGIIRTLALDEELLVATGKPAAVQCIRWTPDRAGTQTSTALLSRMMWLGVKSAPNDIVYDRPMNMFTWIMDDGSVYAVQRVVTNPRDSRDSRALFDGHGFHRPRNSSEMAVKAAINSRFSLAAVGSADGSLWIYSIRDYAGGVTLLRRLYSSVSTSSSGLFTILSYSPDGYCLFAGYEKGWMTWSVYGQPGASSFGQELGKTDSASMKWLRETSHAFWAGGGCELFLFGHKSTLFSVVEFARSALTGCFIPANISKALVQTSTGIKLYQGHDTPDITTITADVSLWHEVEVPSQYLDNQWPIRATAVSPDGRYVAVAGQRGLAHYSVHSGRWKTFDDEEMQDDFTVRGGMCWHQHILIAAVETASSYELRLFSRESNLDHSKVLHTVVMSSPAVHVGTSGDDSILVYSYDNVLDHYVVAADKKTVRLAKVGQIGLHGIIRAPARIRSVSWIVPDHQLQNGDPSQDVAVASVLFLVDGKLVLLQPSTNDDGDLKYDMRVIAQNVEHYLLARDSPDLLTAAKKTLEIGNDASSEYFPPAEENVGDLRDSLWLFDGHNVRSWTDIQSLLESAPAEYGRDLPPSTCSPVDFYPLSILLNKGIAFGVESELSQARDLGFSLFRMLARTSLFIPDILRHLIAQYDSPGALHLSHNYQTLSYFPHALEILLHKVLDEEVEKKPSTRNPSPNPQIFTFPSAPASSQSQVPTTPTIGTSPGTSAAQPGPPLLPTTLSFLSAFPKYYLSTIIACTRKTELRSWRTLFEHLPPPAQLFDSALDVGDLKTAAGYLLVLHTLGDDEENEKVDGIVNVAHASDASDSRPADPPTPPIASRRRTSSAVSSFSQMEVGVEGSAQSEQVVHLLRGVKEQGEWELGKELARFMMAVDGSGKSLRWALNEAGYDGFAEHDDTP